MRTIRLIGGLFACLIGLLAFTGCAGARAQRVTYHTTEVIGKAINNASDAFIAYEISQARAALGPGATRASIRAWRDADPKWVEFRELDGKAKAAYRAWCSANATLATGDTTQAMLANAEFRRQAITTAAYLTDFVVRFVPSITTVKTTD